MWRTEKGLRPKGRRREGHSGTRVDLAWGNLVREEDFRNKEKVNPKDIGVEAENFRERKSTSAKASDAGL